jgi:hypothetical protein
LAKKKDSDGLLGPKPKALLAMPDMFVYTIDISRNGGDSRLKLKISNNVLEKLDERGILVLEIEQAFHNRSGYYLVDDRAKNRTRPPTQWLMAETELGRRLKVCFMFHRQTQEFEIKTAYEPDEDEECLYEENQ